MGELPIIQAGGAGPIQAGLLGADTVILATIATKPAGGQIFICRASGLRFRIVALLILSHNCEQPLRISEKIYRLAISSNNEKS